MESAASPLQSSSDLPRPRFDWVVGAAAALLVWQLFYASSGYRHKFPMGTGLFVFLDVWALIVYDRRRGLQSLSCAALVLATSTLATPPIAVACAVFCLAYYLARVRAHEDPLAFALLLFTPALLCLIGAAVLAALNAGPPAFNHLGAPWPAPLMGRADACFASLGAATALILARIPRKTDEDCTRFSIEKSRSRPSCAESTARGM